MIFNKRDLKFLHLIVWLKKNKKQRKKILFLIIQKKKDILMFLFCFNSNENFVFFLQLIKLILTTVKPADCSPFNSFFFHKAYIQNNTKFHKILRKNCSKLIKLSKHSCRWIFIHFYLILKWCELHFLTNSLINLRCFRRLFDTKIIKFGFW